MNHLLQIYYKAAVDLQLIIHYFPENDCLKIKIGNKNYFFTEDSIPLNKESSFYFSRDKMIYSFILQEAQFSIPKFTLIKKEDVLENKISFLIKKLSYPLIIKTANDTSPNSVIVSNINSLDELIHYLDKFLQKTSLFQVEEFHSGLKEYTVLILNKQVIGVVEHFAPSIIGDGVHNIKQLIVFQNEQQKKEGILRPATIDDECLHCLKNQNLTLDSIPSQHTKINLSHAANKARGSRIVSLGDKIHHENAKILIDAANALNLDWISFNILCDDINQSFNTTTWFIIGVHCSPDITLYEMPDEGQKIRVSQKLLKHLIYQHKLFYLWHSLTQLFRKSEINLYG